MNIVYKGIEFPFRIKDSIKQRRIEDTFFRKLCGESKRGYSQTESL